jgi:hyperosmotically inducible protein
MFRRFFALLILVGLALVGFYYWQVSLHGQRPTSLEAVGRDVRDAATTAAVKTSLGLNRRLQPYAIEPSTREGVVTLKGEVPDADSRATATKVVEAVPEVRHVVNDLRVNPALGAAHATDRSLGERVDDEALGVRVKVALSLKRDLKGTDIDVKTYRKDVTLSGQVSTAAQRQLAEETARDTSGVSNVTDEIKVQGQSSPQGRAAVEKALAANPNLAHYPIQVREEGGKITLTGHVHTGAERDLAGLVAQQAGGEPVQNSLELKP